MLAWMHFICHSKATHRKLAFKLSQNSSCCSTTLFRVLICDVFLSLIVGYLAQMETSVERLYSKLARLMEVMFIYVKNRVDPEAAILMKEEWESDDNSNKRIRNKYKN